MDQSPQDNGGCCCPPFVEENDSLKKMKPVLIGGLVIYSILLILDLFYMGGRLLFEYLLIIVCLSFMIFNRCYLAFHYYTFLSIIIVFSYCLPLCGVIIQNIFDIKGGIILFCINVFILIFSLAFFYFGFQAYKEMKYLFVNRSGSSPQLAGFTSEYPQSDSNYGSNNYSSNNNNSNQNKSKGFKAFSGKGYTVGGS